MLGSGFGGQARSPRLLAAPARSARLLAVAATLTVAGLLAGCTSAGVHTQDVSAASTPPTAPTISVTPTPTASPSWTPPAYGKAQPAVDVYLALNRAYYAAGRHPVATKAEIAKINSYLTGQAKQFIDAEATNTSAYGRGNPPISRLLVRTDDFNGSKPFVVLADCPMQAPTDPWVDYSAKTNKPIQQPASAVRPPYEVTITVGRYGDRWLVTALESDFTKTCTR